MKQVLVWAALFTALAACARDLPYNEAADAKAEVAHVLVAAKAAHQHVLLVFGANWCDDCRALDAALKRPNQAEWLAATFKVIKVDVGNFDRNLDLVKRYGNPIQNGIPAAVILSADDQVLFATRAGELSNARQMNEEGIAQFFKRALAMSNIGQ